jgi:hypothetical protein
LAKRRAVLGSDKEKVSLLLSSFLQKDREIESRFFPKPILKQSSALGADFTTEQTTQYVSTGIEITFPQVPSDGVIILCARIKAKHEVANAAMYVGISEGTSQPFVKGHGERNLAANQNFTKSFDTFYPVTKGNSYAFKLMVYNGTAGTMTVEATDTSFTRLEGIFIPI